MNVRLAYAMGCALFAALLSGCSDAGKCERGTEGCACAETAPPCRSGLSCSNDVCIDNGGGDGDGDGDGDGPPDAGPPPDVDCDSDTVEEACTAFCEAFCENQERFCRTSRCVPEDCEEGGQVLGICMSRCSSAGGEDDQLACAQQTCEDQVAEDLTCGDFGVEVSNPRKYETLCFELDPRCVQKPEIGCTDVCGSNNKVGGDLCDNGFCEDGHEPDSVSGACSRGTDCTDCGPHPCAPTGETCVNHGDCCDFYGDGALCVDPDGPTGSADPFCLPTCTATNPCPTGYRCNPTSRPDTSVCVVE